MWNESGSEGVGRLSTEVEPREYLISLNSGRTIKRMQILLEGPWSKHCFTNMPEQTRYYRSIVRKFKMPVSRDGLENT